MKISINYTSTAEDMENNNKHSWKQYAKKTYREILFALAAGTVLIIIGFNSGPSFRTEENDHITNYNFNLYFSGGMGIILWAIYHANEFWRARKSFFNGLETLKQNFVYPYDVRIELTRDYFKYENSSMTLEYKWSYFSGYKIDANGLSLDLADPNTPGFTIERAKVDPTDFEAVRALISEILQERK